MHCCGILRLSMPLCTDRKSFNRSGTILALLSSLKIYIMYWIFFNSRMDSQRMDGEWSVEKVLLFIINNCRSWRGDGMKIFTQLHFSYEQESHPEEFFIPYVWQLVLSCCGFSFNADAINLFPVDLHADKQIYYEEPNINLNGELNEHRVLFDP
ncbi:dymeclin-like [Hibiscus syriacus]|uniref:dymeclin-like n=1 Tax=Hibiscus syriacus TaxID=106335 RepID=UPI00192264B0|nr:dymeclin-like [Hibiscus syriacus]